MKITYQAFNGEVFEIKEECEEYESEIREYEKELNDYVSIYDENGALIKIPDPCEVLDFLKNYEDNFFIYIKHNEMPDTWEEAALEGLPCSKGLYRYDKKAWKWVSLSDDIKLLKLWKPLVKICPNITYVKEIEGCI